MAKTIARYLIMAKSDRLGKADKKEEDKTIIYAGLLDFNHLDLIDLSKNIVKTLSWGEYFTTQDIEVKPNTECFAVVEVMKDGKPRILSIMSREEYIASLGL